MGLGWALEAPRARRKRHVVMKCNVTRRGEDFGAGMKPVTGGIVGERGECGGGTVGKGGSRSGEGGGLTIPVCMTMFSVINAIDDGHCMLPHPIIMSQPPWPPPP